MSENSKIEWTDHTFNPWWGCQKVSEGCKHCYAETLDNRWKGGHWGPGSSRRAMSASYWAQPLKWNAAAEKAGVKAKVFCASMADVFESHPEVINWRRDLFALIEKTPWLIWQLLTKRPENIMQYVPMKWLDAFPENVWMGTSVENQAAADERIPYLLKVPAAVRFLSCEPLLGPVDLSGIKGNAGSTYQVLKPITTCGDSNRAAIDWVIVGGESGHNARPMHLKWARDIRDRCQWFGVAFLFKQWGEWGPARMQRSETPGKFALAPIDGAGGIIPIGHYPRQFTSFGSMVLENMGKKAAGRLLDGIEHNEFPGI